MCGINLIFAYGASAAPVERSELVRVRDAMRVRGPDGEGAWTAADGRIGLGHRRLAILDLSPAGAQPMAERPDGTGAVITFNGEIYNFRALRAELEEAGARFRSGSDTEVLLALWRRDGEAMVGRLRGMFAFAIWDPARQGVFLARDPFGIKPLYLADDGTTLRAASQVKALLAGDGIDWRPEPAGHAGFFLLGYVPDPFTLYRGIRALPAGTTLWLGRDGMRRERRYFDAGAVLGAARAEAVPDRAALRERLHGLLADAVGSHLVADVPVGVFLSAGRDSTAIAALALEAGGGDLRSVTLGFADFAGRPEDEAPLAEEVARTLGTRHETRRVRGDEFAAAYARLLADMDQPSIDGVNTWFVARATAASGLKVALSGLGGDELFAGYPSFSGVPRLSGLGRHLAFLPGRACLRAALAPWIGKFTSPKYAGLLEYGTTLADAYLLRRALFMPWELAAVMDPDMAREGLDRLDPRAALAATIAGVPTPRTAVSALEIGWYMRSQLLRDSDWAGMAHSLEIRTPFVDATLFRALAPLLVGPIPPGKDDMARAPAVRLPDAVLSRPKSGFNVPVRNWLAAGHGAADAGAGREHGLRGWARSVYDAFVAGRPSPMRVPG